ncbi:MAG: MFS transporter, partial [Actinomycetota bacterium]
AILVAKALFGLSGGTIALLSIIAVKVFDRGDAGIGILMGARGLGALIGPFLWRRLVVRGRDERLMRSIGAAFTLYAVCYGLFAGAPNIWLAALAVCGAHIGGGANWTMSAYAIQRFTPDHIRGRIFAFDYALITVTMGLSFSIAGFAAEHVSPRAVGLTFAGAALVAALSWTPWASTLSTRRHARANA